MLIFPFVKSHVTVKLRFKKNYQTPNLPESKKMSDCSKSTMNRSLNGIHHLSCTQSSGCKFSKHSTFNLIGASSTILIQKIMMTFFLPS